MRQAIQSNVWSNINADLWLRTMTLPASSQAGANSQPHVNSGSAFKPRQRPCFDFNSVRGCS